jgi:hypothetical protein
MLNVPERHHSVSDSSHTVRNLVRLYLQDAQIPSSFLN